MHHMRYTYAHITTPTPIHVQLSIIVSVIMLCVSILSGVSLKISVQSVSVIMVSAMASLYSV